MSERTAIEVQPETVAAAHGVASDTAFGAVMTPSGMAAVDLLAGLEAGLSGC